MDISDHKFGGERTRIKLAALAKYLPAYTTALSKKNFRLNYVDAFAGTGSCRIKVGGGQRVIPGSASIAVACDLPFHRIFFIEAKKRNAKALKALSDMSPDLDIAVIHGDANSHLPDVLKKMNRNSDRGVVFFDPYGMAVDWLTVKLCAESRIVDLWYLFPLSGLYRQAANDARAIDPDKARRLNKMFGTEKWRGDLYMASPQQDMFLNESYDVRSADVNQMTSWVTKHLEGVFPTVVGPRILYQNLKSGKQGAPLFALYLAVSNPNPAARGLASKIARAVLSDSAG